MSPVQAITIHAFGMTHTKPLYLCEECLMPASYGFTVLENNHRRRKWFCSAHKANGQVTDTAKLSTRGAA